MMSKQTTEFAPGQVWVPTNPGSRAKPRTIVWAGENQADPWFKFRTVGWVVDPTKPNFPETGHDSWLDESSFRAWVRKHRATCRGATDGR